MSILDPRWKYTHSSATDIRKTFAKARRQLAQSKVSKQGTPTSLKVQPLVRRKRSG